LTEPITGSLTYTVPITGGSGSGAILEFSGDATGITYIKVTSPGTGYIKGDILTVTATTETNISNVTVHDTGRTTDLVFTLTENGELNSDVDHFKNKISSLTDAITAGTYENLSISGGSGRGAKLKIVAETNNITEVTVTNPGTNYFEGDTLTVTGDTFIAAVTGRTTDLEFTLALTDSDYTESDIYLDPTLTTVGPMAERMIVDSNGYVGIGTTAPQSKLDVEGSVRIGSGYSGNNTITTNPTNGMIIEGNVGIGTTAPQTNLDISNNMFFDVSLNSDSTYTNIITGADAYNQNTGNLRLKGGWSADLSQQNYIDINGRRVIGVTGILNTTTDSLLDSVSIFNPYLGGDSPSNTMTCRLARWDTVTNQPTIPYDTTNAGWDDSYATIFVVSTYGNDGNGNNTHTIGISLVQAGNNPAPALPGSGYAVGDICKVIYGVDINFYNLTITLTVDNLDPIYDNGNVDLVTNNTTRVHVNDDGNVGIGTTNPGATLDISGNVRLNGGTNSTVNALSIYTSNIGVTGVSNGTNRVGYCAQTIGVNILDPNVNSGKILQNTTSGGVNGITGAVAINFCPDSETSITNGPAFSIWTSPQTGSDAGTPLERRFCVTDNGNVGIGTDSPSGKLHVYEESESVNCYFESNYINDDYPNGYGNGQNVNLIFKNKTYQMSSISGVDEAEVYNDTHQGSLVFKTQYDTNLNEQMRINSLGNVGIGIDIPTAKLDVRGNILSNTGSNNVVSLGVVEASQGCYINWNWDGTTGDGCTYIVNNKGEGSGGFYFYNQADSATLSTPLFGIDSTGGVSADSYNATSDMRHKENVCDLENSLEKIKAIRGVKFNFKGNDRIHSGIIAQEVDEIIPEAICKSNDEKWSANYNTFIGYLIESVKTLSKENDALKQENETLKTKVGSLESKMDLIMQHLNL
jgi:hypothetical protein